MTVVELRRYRLRPGRRDELVDLFERELVAPQEAVGMAVLATFTDADEPDHFVWLRGFADLATRDAGLRAFYGGPVWATHGPAANATMLDSDDVHLLRPVGELSFDDAHAGAVLVTITAEGAAPAIPGGRRLAHLETEPSPNSFPRLPVHTKQVTVALTAFDDLDRLDATLATAPPPADGEARARLVPTPGSRLGR